MKVTCSCGRECASRSGFATHARKCLVEQERSRRVVESVERSVRERLAQQQETS